jgi:hypothetical protein
MPSPSHDASLEAQIDQWRKFLRRRQVIDAVDVDELEDHLREQVAGLVAAGLATDEAFLVAVKRMGNLDALSREFALEHSERLWKQLMLVPLPDTPAAGSAARDALVAFGFAVAAALAVKLPALFGLGMESHEEFYLRNFALFVLPLLAGYFAWKRPGGPRTMAVLAAGFAAAAVIANAYAFAPAAHTLVLQVLHLPIALWLLVGIAYAAGRWNQVAGRMDFIRFSGELAIYFVLIALGGGVLTGLTAMTFQAIGIDVEYFVGNWVMPCGAAGAVLIAAWLVEAKQGVIENMAPVLTRLFTPMFAAALLVFLGTLAWTGRGIDIGRDVLIGFDLLLVAVIGLLLYSASARDPHAPPDAFDIAQVMLLAGALATDAVLLWAIAARLNEFGASPNRIAALGENIILLVNLAWSAVLYIRFLRGRAPFQALERWQTGYLPVYAAWAAVVVILFPPLFGFA